MVLTLYERHLAYIAVDGPISVPFPVAVSLQTANRGAHLLDRFIGSLPLPVT
jgi:hypothetical protein